MKMNGLLLRLAALSVGIILGVGSSMVYNTHRTISFCDIDLAPAEYAGHLVRLHAYISKDNGFIVAISLCGHGDVAGAGVDLEPGQITRIRNGVHTRDAETGYFVYEVILVGTFDPPDGMLHCFSPKYHISNARIERILSEKEFPSSKELSEWFNSEAH